MSICTCVVGNKKLKESMKRQQQVTPFSFLFLRNKKAHKQR